MACFAAWRYGSERPGRLLLLDEDWINLTSVERPNFSSP